MKHYTQSKDPILLSACKKIEAAAPLTDEEQGRFFQAWISGKYYGIADLVIRAECLKAKKKCPMELTDREVLHISLEEIIEAKDKDLGPDVDKTEIRFKAVNADGKLRCGYVKAIIFLSDFK